MSCGETSIKSEPIKSEPIKSEPIGPEWTAPEWTAPEWTAPEWTAPEWTAPEWTAPEIDPKQVIVCGDPDACTYELSTVIFHPNDERYLVGLFRNLMNPLPDDFCLTVHCYCAPEALKVVKYIQEVLHEKLGPKHIQFLYWDPQSLEKKLMTRDDPTRDDPTRDGRGWIHRSHQLSLLRYWPLMQSPTTTRHVLVRDIDSILHPEDLRRSLESLSRNQPLFYCTPGMDSGNWGAGTATLPKGTPGFDMSRIWNVVYVNDEDFLRTVIRANPSQIQTLGYVSELHLWTALDSPSLGHIGTPMISSDDIGLYATRGDSMKDLRLKADHHEYYPDAVRMVEYVQDEKTRIMNIMMRVLKSRAETSEAE